MEIQNGVALRVFPMEKLADELDATRAVVHMPVGSKPFDVIPLGRGVGICVILPRVVGPRVPHPVLAMPADVPVIPLLGRSLGEPIGVLLFGDTPLAIVPELPWPQPEDAANG